MTPASSALGLVLSGLSTRYPALCPVELRLNLQPSKQKASPRMAQRNPMSMSLSRLLTLQAVRNLTSLKRDAKRLQKKSQQVFGTAHSLAVCQQATESRKDPLNTTCPHLRAFFCLCSRSYFHNFAIISEADTSRWCGIGPIRRCRYHVAGFNAGRPLLDHLRAKPRVCGAGPRSYRLSLDGWRCADGRISRFCACRLIFEILRLQRRKLVSV